MVTLTLKIASLRVMRSEKHLMHKEQRNIGKELMCAAVVLSTRFPEDAPFFVKDYYDYYKTSRGYHKRSLNSNDGWNVTGCMSFMNMPILCYSSEIRSAVLMIHGEKAHSCYFSRDAFEKLKGDNKELLIIPDAVHTDLYDQMDVIPFDKMVEFFRENLTC